MAKIKLSSKITIPASVADAQKEYAKFRKGLVRRAYTDVLKERTKSMIKNFKIHKVPGVLFTFLGFRWRSDYKKMRSGGIKEIKGSSLRARLDALGYALSAEIARNPKMRKAVATLAKDYPYLLVDKKGNLFVSSYSGSMIDKSTLAGMIFNPENLIPSLAEARSAKNVMAQKLDLKLILAMGSPKFEEAQVSSRVKRSGLSPPKNITLAVRGNDEIKVFSRTGTGSSTISKEEIIKSDEVKSKRIVASPLAGKKIIWLKMKNGKLVKLETDAKHAEVVFKAFKLKE